MRDDSEKILRNITDVCHDCDGTLYDYGQHPEIHTQFGLASAQSLITLLPETKLTLDEAVQYAIDSYEKYHDSMTGYIELSEDHGKNPDEFRHQLFHLYNKTAFKIISKSAPHLFSPDPDMIGAFRKLNGDVKHGIATHGCANEWAIPVLTQRQILQFIDKNAIVGFQHSNFVPKHIAPVLVDLCFEQMQSSEGGRAFTEDVTINLRIAKEQQPKLVTIFIHHGRPMEQQPSYINFQFRNIAELLNAIYEAKKLPSRSISLP